MSKVEDFLSKADELAVVEAIRLAERQTSGEIRIHLEKTTNIETLERAKKVFFELKMNETQLQNGVLIYVAVDDKKIAICGDKGIDNVVSAEFWESTKNKIVDQFKAGDFKQGLIDGIIEAGIQLQKYFPSVADDKDELSNEISIG
ncbi:MAG: hypothetical protein RLZZ312_1549 [Bacteroidota bacterium]|jgi:uncharacterized membrane protein